MLKVTLIKATGLWRKRAKLWKFCCDGNGFRWCSSSKNLNWRLLNDILSRCVVMRWLGATDWNLYSIWHLNTSSRRWNYDFLELSSTKSSSMFLWREVWDWIWKTHLNDWTVMMMRSLAALWSSWNDRRLDWVLTQMSASRLGLNRVLGTGTWDMGKDANWWF